MRGTAFTKSQRADMKCKGWIFCRPFRTHGVVGILFPWADAIAKLFRHFVAAAFGFGRAGVEMGFHYLSHMSNMVLVQEVVVPQRDNFD